jgi:hypothetical protein
VQVKIVLSYLLGIGHLFLASEEHSRAGGQACCVGWDICFISSVSLLLLLLMAFCLKISAAKNWHVL